MKVCHALDFLTSPGGSTEKIYLYAGLVDSSGARGCHGLLSESEDIRVLSVPLQDALALVDSGRIRNSIAIAGLQYLALHKKEICDLFRG
jgi:ADP-ribose pyrophosphatase